MKPSELSKLGYDTTDFNPAGDYVPDVETSEDGVHPDLVLRAYQQLAQLNALGGVNTLGGSAESLDAIYLALEDAMDLVTAVELFEE